MGLQPVPVKNVKAKKTRRGEPKEGERGPRLGGHSQAMTCDDESPKGKSSRRRDRTWGVVSSRQNKRIGCVNVTTLGDPNNDGRAELAMDTLSRYRMDICGLSEVRWAGSGHVKVAGYDIFYSGNERGGMYGVGIAIRSSLTGSVSAWEPDVAEANAKDDFFSEMYQVGTFL